MSSKAQTPQTPEQASSETQAPETQATETQAPPEAKQEKKDAAPKPVQAEAGEPVEDIAVLAVRHRVASWEQAALARMMGWADGKMVTDAAYQAALAKLHGRRLGGGRIA